MVNLSCCTAESATAALSQLSVKHRTEQSAMSRLLSMRMESSSCLLTSERMLESRMLGSGDRDPFPGSQLELGVTVVLPSASIYRSGHNVFGVREASHSMSSRQVNAT